MSGSDMYEAAIFECGSIELFDKYIESKKHYLLLTTNLHIKYKDTIYSINFVFSNKIEIGKKIVRTNITMTEFKKIYNAFCDYNKFCDCERVLNYSEKVSATDRRAVPKFSVPVLDFIELFYSHFCGYMEHNEIENKIVFFDNPISVNAQSSINRTGYGNEYFFDKLVYEGTKYGETSEFPIIGYKITKYGKVQKDYILIISEDESVTMHTIPEYLR